MRASSRPPSGHDAALAAALWPAERVGEAIRALGRHLDVPAAPGECSVPPDNLGPDDVHRWVSAVAEREGLQAERAFPSFAECTGLLAAGAPALLRLQTVDGPAYLAVAGGTRRSLAVVQPDLQSADFPLEVIDAAIRRPLEESMSSELDRLFERVPLGAAGGARSALLAEHQRVTRVGGCWLLRPPAAERLREAASQAGLTRGAAMLAAAHTLQAVLFVGSWWLLGRGLLEGRLDRGWLLGWLLLVLSLVPFRLATSWLQGLLAIAAGASLRRRLLEGALRIEPQDVRAKGAGQFFGLIAESAAVEALALSGGIVALLALLELALAGAVLVAAAGWLPAVLLFAWLASVGWLTRRYMLARRRWTGTRLAMTDRLVEHMVGHRTRLVQQPLSDRHRLEDDALERYTKEGVRMDGWELRLLAIAPRGWLMVGIGALAPAAFAGASSGRVAAAIGGTLLAYRALRRLTGGLADLAGAYIAGELVLPLVRAASLRESPTAPSAAVPASAPGEGVVALARDVVFRYRSGGPPVLQDCSLRITRGNRLLLEGPSGSGKTTLASLLSGLLVPESGVVLVDGLDRGVLGSAGWRARVVMAPQPHDNYLVGGSLALNLLMGRQWPARPQDLAEAEQVCRELGLGELLSRMPGGLHQTVGETGWQLSQGERTRVFLARAVLQRPDLLVLDESFSALDPENIERAVRCITQRAATVVAIAHT